MTLLLLLIILLLLPVDVFILWQYIMYRMAKRDALNFIRKWEDNVCLIRKSGIQDRKETLN